ncbi:Ulp1 protease family, C-terminal catalytic domain containing [Olea europaea subsp. europaea]|uniref:Ulp1 protease family, C-terminal catalytic domain containing n=1 Tax=Olea europaea subsp. europaea TaxID=158383 RepID=A0A8S0R6T0_OLEEU|nr:Ulp1 protease family, C-terminal catalytic domain containing [Olea europaea subsp. europaea]
MIKYSSLISFKGTTADSFFGAMVRSAFKHCREDIRAISNFRSLVEYVNGDYVHCDARWADVEHVLIPIMMEKKAHWILVHFDIEGERLLVYNSSRMTVRERIVTSDVEAFAHVLPCLMVKMNAYEVKTIDEI